MWWVWQPGTTHCLSFVKNPFLRGSLGLMLFVPSTARARRPPQTGIFLLNEVVKMKCEICNYDTSDQTALIYGQMRPPDGLCKNCRKAVLSGDHTAVMVAKIEDGEPIPTSAGSVARLCPAIVVPSNAIRENFSITAEADRALAQGWVMLYPESKLAKDICQSLSPFSAS